MPLQPSLPAGTAMLPADTFAGDVVLITGAGTLAIAAAIEFARAGARVVVRGLADGALAGADAALSQRVLGIEFDVCDPDRVKEAFDTLESSVGAVSVLVNHAGSARMAASERQTLGEWRTQTAPVLDGTFVCATEYARRRIAAGRRGAVLNVVETTFNGNPGTAAASAARAAVFNLTQSLAVEWAADDIRVNAIAPGLFEGDDTPAHRFARREGVDAAKTVPAHRLGSPQEFGWAASFLCSPYPAYMTGALFVIDGANSLRRGISGPPFQPVRRWAFEFEAASAAPEGALD
jgi:NAD(P)-dependent dehydrogenase (short-subunit alcohol dehydrogenase family)